MLAVYTLFIPFVSLSAQSPSARSTTQKLDRYLTAAHQADRFNGVALVVHKGKALLHKAYGVRNAATKAPNDTATHFPLLSITKSFTVALLLRLQEQGELSVNDKLSQYVPHFPNGDQITLHHLLTHTSGLFNYTELIDEEDSVLVCHPVPKQRIIDLFRDKPLAFTPGQRFSYSNSGYFLLGLVIEKATGKSYEQSMRELIFQLPELALYASGRDLFFRRSTIAELRSEGMPRGKWLASYARRMASMLSEKRFIEANDS